MIKFFRTPNCTACQAIEQVLAELCIAHKVILVYKDTKSKEKLPEGTKPHVLVDDREIVGQETYHRAFGKAQRI